MLEDNSKKITKKEFVKRLGLAAVAAPFIAPLADAKTLFYGDNVTSTDVNTGHLQIDTSATPKTSAPGLIQWNSTDATLDVGLLNGSILQMGQEEHIYGKATEDIPNGSLCQYTGVQGDHLLIKKANNTEIIANPHYLIGVATQEILNNHFGYVTWFGKVNGVYTKNPQNQDSQDWLAGDVLYFDNTTGYLTKTAPVAPGRRIIFAVVVKEQTGSAENGILMIRPSFGSKLTDLDDVNGTPLTTDGQIMVWDNTGKYFDATKNINDYLLGNQTITLSGDITGSGSTSITADISAGVVGATELASDAVETAKIKNSNVTYAKMQDVTGSRLVGRYDSSTGTMQEIQLGTGLSFSGAVINADQSGSGTATWGGINGDIEDQTDLWNALKETQTIGLNISCENNGLISPGLKNNYLYLPYACTIKSWRIVGNTTGSIVIDVWKANGSIPTVANTITGTEKPTLSSQQINSDTNLTTWTTSCAVNDIIAFNVDSVSGLGGVTLILEVEI